jgi:hypothetical protein
LIDLDDRGVALSVLIDGRWSSDSASLSPDTLDPSPAPPILVP